MNSRPEQFFGKRNVAALLAGSGVFVLAYLVLAMSGGEGGSALLFASMPFLSALMVGMLAPREFIYRSCYFSLLLNLILSPFMFAEGFFCVIMAAPIFAIFTFLGGAAARFSRYGDSAFIAWRLKRKKRLTASGLMPPIDSHPPDGLAAPLPESAARPPDPAPSNKKVLMLLIATILGASMLDEVSLRQGAPIETVSTVIELNGTRDEIWKRLSFERAPNAKVPLWLRPWVAQPERYQFSDEGLGARRFTDFGKPRYGDDADVLRNKLVYEITEWRPGERCTFTCKENHSRMRQWMDLLDTRIALEDAEAGGTRVTFVTRYRRRIGPSLYFTPFLNEAVRGMHQMLAEEIGFVGAGGKP